MKLKAIQVLLVAIISLSLPFVGRAQTITITSVTGTPVCAGSSITVAFNLSGLTSNDSVSMSLSDASGSFGAPTLLDTVSVALSTTMLRSVSVPSTAVYGSLYKVRATVYHNKLSASFSTSAAFEIDTTLTGIPAITGSSLLCAPGSVTLSNALGNGANRVWSTTTPAIATVNTVGVVSRISSGNAIIQYKFTNACNSDSTTYSLAVDSLPVIASIAGPSRVCELATIALTNDTLGGTWSSTNTLKATIDAFGVVSGVSAGNTTISYLVTNAAGCASSVTKSVTVDPLPAFTGTTHKYICSGTSAALTLSANPSSSFNWSVASGNTINISGAQSGTSATISNTLTNPSDATSDSVQYKVVMTTTRSCSDSAYISVVVDPTPTFSSITNSVAICSGASVASQMSFSLSTPGVDSVHFVPGSPGTIVNATNRTDTSITDVLTNTATIPGSIQYSVTPVSGLHGCVGIPGTVTVTVNPTPAITTAINQPYCSEQKLNIGLTATVPSTFAWVIVGYGNGPVGVTDNGTTGFFIQDSLVNPSHYTVDTVKYQVTPTAPLGSCIGNPTIINAIVKPIPLVTNSATISICSGSSPNDTLKSTLPSAFSWTVTSNPNISGAITTSDSIIRQALVNSDNVVAYDVIYNVTAVSAGGASVGQCISPVLPITISVKPAPAINTGTSSLAYCSGETIAVNLSSPGNPSNYTWTPGVTSGVSGANPGAGNTIQDVLINSSSVVANTVIYSVSAVSTLNNCSSSGVQLISVTVNPKPQTIITTPYNICSGLQANDSLIATTPSTFSWDIIENTGSIAGAAPRTGYLPTVKKIDDLLINPSNDSVGHVKYVVTAKSDVGTCYSKEDTITVAVYPKPQMTSTIPYDSVCSGTNLVVNLSAGPVPSTFTWEVLGHGNVNGATPGFTAIASSFEAVLTNPADSVADSVTYLIYPTSAYTTSGLPSCRGINDTVTIKVNPSPNIRNIFASYYDVCSGSTRADTLKGSTYSTKFYWNTTLVGALLSPSSLSDSGRIIKLLFNNSSNSLDDNVIFLISSLDTATGCLGNTKTYTLNIHPLPKIVVTKDSVCNYGQTTTNLVNGTGNVINRLYWSIIDTTGVLGAQADSSSSGIYQTLQSPSNVGFNYTDSVTYRVTAVTNYGCVNNPIQDVVMYILPIPQVAASSKTICSESSVDISLNSIMSIPASVIGTSWSASSTIGSDIINPSSSTGNITGNVNSDHYHDQVSLNIRFSTIRGANGCTNEGKGQKLTYYINVNPKPQSPLFYRADSVAPCIGSQFQTFINGRDTISDRNFKYTHFKWSTNSDSNVIMQDTFTTSLITFNTHTPTSAVILTGYYRGYQQCSSSDSIYILKNTASGHLAIADSAPDVLYKNSLLICLKNDVKTTDASAKQYAYQWGYDNVTDFAENTVKNAIFQTYNNNNLDEGNKYWWVKTTDTKGCPQKTYYNGPLAELRSIPPVAQDNININLYPNPADNLLTVEANDKTVSGLFIEIYDITGRKVATQLMSSYISTFSIDNLRSGNYIVTCRRNGENIWTSKFVKN